MSATIWAALGLCAAMSYSKAQYISILHVANIPDIPKSTQKMLMQAKQQTNQILKKNPHTFCNCKNSFFCARILYIFTTVAHI